MRRPLIPLLILLTWELLAQLLPGDRIGVMLPAPSRVGLRAWELMIDGTLLIHVAASGARVLVGFGLAALVGVASGLALALSRGAGRLVLDLVDLLRPIPPVAWIPISILWFGVSEAQQVFIIFLGAFFPIMLSTREAIRAVDPRYIRAAMTLDAPRRALATRVLLPAALPGVLTGLRVGLGFAWFVIVAAEFVSAPDGLGFLILEGRNIIDTERTLVGMVSIGLVGFGMTSAMGALARRIAPWHDWW